MERHMTQEKPVTLIRTSTLLQRVPFTARHILNLEKKGQFPKRRQLGARCVAWVESEVDAWLKARQQGAASAPFPAVDQS